MISLHMASTVNSNYLGKILVAAALSLVACATSEKTNDSNSLNGPKTKISAAPPAPLVQESRASGTPKLVTTTLVNNGSIEGNVPSSILVDVLSALDEQVRKEPNNVQLATTHLGLLRLYNSNPAMQDGTLKRAGAAGAANPWFLLEGAYMHMARKEFSMADYLLGRAQKTAKGNPIATAALMHATGVRLYLDGKEQAGLFEMKKAAEGENPFLPSLLTVGFASLRTGDYKTAETMFANASQKAPNSILIRLGSAAAMRVQGRAADAIPLLAPLYRSHANDKRIAWNYALALSEGSIEQQKQALELLPKALQLPGTGEIDARISSLLTKLQTIASEQEKAKAPAKAPEANKSSSAAVSAQPSPAAAGAK
jgi:hypothetical protein